MTQLETGYIRKMKEFLLVILFVGAVLSSDETKLLGEKDGHEIIEVVDMKYDVFPIHEKDEGHKMQHHQIDNGGLIGIPDGHEIFQKSNVDSDFLHGRTRGHEIHHKIDNGGLIGRPDGHEAFHKSDGDSKLLDGRTGGHKIDEGGLEAYDKKYLQENDLNGLIDGNFDNVLYKGGIEKPKEQTLEKLTPSYKLKGAHDGDISEYKKHKSEDVDGSFDNDDLVRCKRPICQEMLSCAFGPKTDHNGCHICECLENPCEGHSCEVGYMCNPEECIRGQKCDVLGFKCTRKRCRGPSPMCANRCEYGYALNSGGCDTCLCRMPPFDNEDEEGSDEVHGDDSSKEDDEDDQLDDEEDDETRSEDDDDETHSNDEDDEDEEPHSNDEDDEDDETEDEDTDHDSQHTNLIPQDSQASHCGSTCSLSHFCDKNQRDCKKRTKCWLQSQHPNLFTSSSHSSPLSCDSVFWKYQPLQCTNQDPRVCWCVDVIGREVQNTKTTVIKDELEPICKERLIASVTMALEFRIIGEGTGKGRLTDLIMTALSDLSTARKIDMELFMEPVKHVRLLCHVTLKHSNKYDLGYAVEVIRLFSNMTFNSEDFEVSQMKVARVGLVKEYVDDSQQDTIDLPWHDVFQMPNEMPSSHRMHINMHTRTVLMTSFIAMVAAVVLLLLVLIYRLYKRRGVIRHHPLPSHLPSTISPSNFLRASTKSDKVLLVDNDSLDSARVA